MDEMRLLLRDRWSGGMLAAIASVCLILQLVLSASACAAALVALPDPLTVLCHGEAAADASPVSQTPDRTEPDCRCPSGVLCGTGVAFTAPDLPVSAGSRSRGDAVAIRFAASGLARPASPAASGKPFATGPPSILA